MTNKAMTREEKNAARLEKMRANLSRLESAAAAILEKPELTHDDRLQLLQLLNIAYHESGKIETIASVDSCAACGFCEKMRNAAKNNKLIICGYCYAYADQWKEAAWRRHKLNALILSSVLFTMEELKTLAIPSMRCRINEDGDIVNVTHARNIVRLALSHSYIEFGFFFKNYEAVESGLHAEGIHKRADLPKNIRFIQSSYMIGIKARPLWFTHCVFTVYPNEELTLQAIAAGEFACNGRKCKDCGYHCYNTALNDDNVAYIAELLRCGTPMRADILKAYYNYTM